MTNQLQHSKTLFTPLEALARAGHRAEVDVTAINAGISALL